MQSCGFSMEYPSRLTGLSSNLGECFTLHVGLPSNPHSRTGELIREPKQILYTNLGIYVLGGREPRESVLNCTSPPVTLMRFIASTVGGALMRTVAQSKALFMTRRMTVLAIMYSVHDNPADVCFQC